MLAGINIFAVFVSALVSLGTTFVWFTVFFRQAYIAELGRTQAQLDAGQSAIVASAFQFVGFLVLATGLAWLMHRTDMTTISGGIALAIFCWGVFFAAIVGPMYAYQAFPALLYGIVAGGYLVAFLATGLILGMWR